jgi:hypothetical protein
VGRAGTRKAMNVYAEHKLNVYAEHIQRHKHLNRMFMPNRVNGIKQSKLNGYAEDSQRHNHPS